jgi:hypothetical protein
MICGATLIAYGIIAPAGILLRSAVQGGDVSDSAAANTATASAAAISTAAARVTTPSSVPSAQVVSPKKIESKASTPTASVKAVNKTAAMSPAQMKNRREILKLYAKWKDAWRTHNIDAIMTLYSPRVRFRLAGSGYLNHTDTRETLIGLWGHGGYIVHDKETPHLNIDGDQAVLIAGQGYQTSGQRQSGQLYTCRYILELEEISRSTPSGMVQSGSPKASGAGKVRQWRIVRNEYLPYQGSSDRRSQIY